MNRRTLASVITLLFLIGVVAAQSRRPAGTAHNGNAFRFNKVTEGVYHAIGTGSLAVVGNSSVIVNDNDVIIVDDHVSPAAAWVLLEEVKTLTKKPVTTVINTKAEAALKPTGDYVARSLGGTMTTKDLSLSADVHRWMVYSVDFKTGKVRWQRQVREGAPTQARHMKNSHASETISRATGLSYLKPSAILAPRTARVGFRFIF